MAEDLSAKTSLHALDADVASISSDLSAAIADISQVGVSAEEAAAAFKALGAVIGSSPRNIVLTRPKGKNRDTARIEGKDIHGGHVSVSPRGVKTFEVLVNYEDRFILNPFQVGDRVIMSGKLVPKKLNLQIVERKIDHTDRALLIMEDQVLAHRRKPPPETEEEALDIMHELRQ